MASHPPPEPPVHLIIDPESDLTIRLVNRQTTKDPNTEKVSEEITVRATYKVCRQTLTDNSPVFSASLGGWGIESKRTIVDVEDGTVKSYELWFRILHNAMVPEIYDLDIKEVVAWSEQWMSRLKVDKISLDDMKSLLYPAKEPDCIREFKWMTRKLVYGMSEHIQETNPTTHRHLHLANNVMGALNGARGNLHSKLIKGLFDPIDWFLKQMCKCKEALLFSSCKGLSKTGIWPLETHHKKNVQEILDSFDKFVCVIATNTCLSCRSKLSPSAIENVRISIQAQFGGLCLDCMDHSMPDSEERFAYFAHDIGKRWDTDCRITHGQPSWYWSHMGQRPDILGNIYIFMDNWMGLLM
ncbi:hypothetical protein DSL72_000306 [Monilinia vaccinii-corymbosi]|uniref:BTB domain-containing protein n=1 Tax=Monilinia vaccinii-corymbosi TaxID=61207 RepID=A0A8A3P8D5_9HELO|nr:hypothetical protein DSL72_000306 [Monilinia vaccinii-corymbosi]